MSDIVMCSIYPEQRAVALYQWPWGEGGACSMQGQQSLRQQAENLGRTGEIVFSPLPQAEAPLERTERTMLIAERLSAESERDDTLKRNSALYAENTRLAQELTTARLRNKSADEQIAHLTKRIDESLVSIESLARDKAAAEDRAFTAEQELARGPLLAQQEIEGLRQQLAGANARVAEVEAQLLSLG